MPAPMSRWRPRRAGRSVGRVNRVVASIVGTGTIVIVLSACASSPQPAVTRLPPGFGDAITASTASPPAPSVIPAAPSPTPAPVSSSAAQAPDRDVVTCAEGESRSISGSEQNVRVEGPCAQLSISGSGMTVDASTARVGSLAVAGDRVSVDAADITTLSVQGNDGLIRSAGAIGSVDLSGDRTRVTAVGSISSVAVRGQENSVTAGGGIGDSMVQGRDNQVG